MKDAAFINNPDNWPHWPYLPLRRVVTNERGYKDTECGTIFARTGGLTTVIKVNMFSIPKTIGELDKLPKYEYETVEKLLDDGWCVD